MNDTTASPGLYKLPCPACGGSGIQRNEVTGINERCPVCDGSGKRISTELVVTY